MYYSNLSGTYRTPDKPWPASPGRAGGSGVASDKGDEIIDQLHGRVSIALRIMPPPAPVPSCKVLLCSENPPATAVP